MKIIFLLQLKPNWNPLKIVRRRQILLLTIQGKKNSTNPQTDRKRRLQFRKCFFFSSQGGERSWWGSYNAWETRAIVRVGWEVMMEQGYDRWQLEDGSIGGGGTWVLLWRWGLLHGRRVKTGYGESQSRGEMGGGEFGFLYEGGWYCNLRGAFYVKTNAALHSMIMLCPGRCLEYDANDSKYNFHELFSSINVGSWL